MKKREAVGWKQYLCGMGNVLLSNYCTDKSYSYSNNI